MSVVEPALDDDCDLADHEPNLTHREHRPVAYRRAALRRANDGISCGSPRSGAPVSTPSIASPSSEAG
jgi:hypothetical protein